MLAIPRTIAEAITEQARKHHPHEVCGFIAGPAGSDRPTRLVRMANTCADPVLGFQFDPAQQLAEWAEMDRRGEDPIVIYHTHTRGPATPSDRDIRYMLDPGIHYLIVSMLDPDRPDTHVATSWRTYGGAVIPEPMTYV